MGEAKWQLAQCWNERRVNLIDKHRWCLNLTTFRSYLTTCCSLLRLASVFPRESLSLSLSVCRTYSLSPFLLLSLSVFLSSSFLVAARIEQPYSCLPDPRCKIATTGRMKFRLLDEGEAANAASEAGKRVEGKLETRAERNGNRTDFRSPVVSRFTVTRAYVIFPLRRERIFRERHLHIPKHRMHTALSGLSP